MYQGRDLCGQAVDGEKGEKKMSSGLGFEVLWDTEVEILNNLKIQ